MAYNKPQKITGQMPGNHHVDDSPWIWSKLSSLSQEEREIICHAYSKAYLKAHNDEPLSHRKDGRARQHANGRLLVYINKKFAVFNK